MFLNCIEKSWIFYLHLYIACFMVKWTPVVTVQSRWKYRVNLEKLVLLRLHVDGVCYSKNSVPCHPKFFLIIYSFDWTCVRGNWIACLFPPMFCFWLTLENNQDCFNSQASFSHRKPKTWGRSKWAWTHTHTHTPIAMSHSQKRRLALPFH